MSNVDWKNSKYVSVMEFPNDAANLQNLARDSDSDLK